MLFSEVGNLMRNPGIFLLRNAGIFLCTEDLASLSDLPVVAKGTKVTG